MAAAELPSLVEDEDEGLLQKQPAKKKWWDLHTWEWGRILSYRTPRVVTIKDLRLGVLYWSMVTIFIMYSIIFVFNMEGRHTQQATGTGTASTHFKGKGFAGDKVFDTADLRFPVTEPTGAFIMSRRVMVKNQRLGDCVDWDSPVKCPCKGNSTCRNGHCARPCWCPSLGDFNTKSTDMPEGAVQENILGLEDSILHIDSSISFPAIGNQFFVTGDAPDAKNPFANIRLGDLLAMAGTSMKEVQKRGALISVALMWRCDVGQSRFCEPNTLVKRLDHGQGFSQKRAKYRRDENGEEVRDATYLFGVRVLVDCSGVGRQASLPLVIVQIGSCIALLRVAMWVTDFVMLTMWPSAERRLAYKQCKINYTEDYSDLQERLNLIKTENRKEARVIQASGTRSGTHVPLGLGAGGRAGMPATVLRGRTYSGRLGP